MNLCLLAHGDAQMRFRACVFLAGLALWPMATAVPVAAEVSPFPYPLSTCIVSGEPLGSYGDPVISEFEGREIRFCRADCEKTFAADVLSHLAKVDSAIVASQLAIYPLETCVVDGQPLQAMGEPHGLVHGNRLIRLCCASCQGAFEASADSLLGKLDGAAITQQRQDYPLDYCVISGEQLGSMGEPYETAVAGRLVRLCCQGCLKGLHTRAHEALASLDAARVRK